ncbi:MFS transporter [Streptomyces sp. NBC_01264]|uniref:MFS transporter n=1 Tax=Streptomyces sp. NBC_01264 TaxID=2903804 RepID=UPI0022500181|nr:MFS transporter [Streptomyces sp. NBC_01264]MCX4781694.1 MFS transporter [Streptomyces sp. NBC_01264]
MPPHPGATSASSCPPPPTAAARAAGRPDGPARLRPVLVRYAPLAVLSAAAGLDAGGVAVLNSALPSMGAHFATSAQSLSWAATGYAIAFAGLLLCGGAMADRLRQRPVLVAGLMTVAAGAALAFAAPVFWMVVAGRVLQGAGAALTLPAATALLTAVYPDGPMRSRVLGVFSAAQAGCYGAGLVLGGLVTSAFGWRWLFALQALAAAATVVGAMRWLPVGARDDRARLDRTGAGILVAAIVLLVLGADLASRPGGGLLAALTVLAAAVAGCLWWRRGRSRGGEASLLDPGLLRVNGVRTAAVIAGAFYFCVTGSLFLLPLYLQQVRGMTPASSGLAILPVSVAVTGAALLSGRLMKTRGPRPLLMWGILLTAGGVLLWCTAGAHSAYGGAVLAGLCVSGFGQGLAFPALVATGLRDVPGDAHGTASAATTTALQIGSGIGPTVLAGVAQAIGGTGPHALSLPGLHLAYAVAAGFLLLVGLPAGARLGAEARAA